jgi:2-oxoglutarate dehydrogenase E2 component (dihydrolipoamide succinyltransferase)
MAFEVKIPTLGESVTEGVIVRWAKQDGERVERDEILLELETDKASMEIASERAGCSASSKDAGATVTVGEVVARVEEGARCLRRRQGEPATAASPDPPHRPHRGAPRRRLRQPRLRATAASRFAAPVARGADVRSDRSARRSVISSTSTRSIPRRSRVGEGRAPDEGRRARASRAGWRARGGVRLRPRPRRRPCRSPRPRARCHPAPARAPAPRRRRKVRRSFRSAGSEAHRRASRPGAAHAAILTTFNEVDLTK